MRMQKIKIAVFINSQGHWKAHGQMSPKDYDKQRCDELWSRRLAMEDVNTSNPHTLVWVETEVPIPEDSHTVVVESPLASSPPSTTDDNFARPEQGFVATHPAQWPIDVWLADTGIVFMGARAGAGRLSHGYTERRMVYLGYTKGDKTLNGHWYHKVSQKAAPAEVSDRMHLRHGSPPTPTQIAAPPEKWPHQIWVNATGEAREDTRYSSPTLALGVTPDWLEQMGFQRGNPTLNGRMWNRTPVPPEVTVEVLTPPEAWPEKVWVSDAGEVRRDAREGGAAFAERVSSVWLDEIGFEPGDKTTGGRWWNRKPAAW